ncbi:hypothetical protein PhCBS80983_g04378 [Powellomyces hirtus]|uniref:t-SNARE coiled-coil homology domain-containing protein n=1 Tax=Powellomyces hirtus TaxID=109895 RepID=A0A507DYX8_9FUNG|nr:hypothetical protein PhCBS80983_g04378 [Powellomyces hirtus]
MRNGSSLSHHETNIRSVSSGNPFGAGIRRAPSSQTPGQASDGDDDSGDEVAKLVALSKKTLEVQESSVEASARALATARQAEQLGLENLSKVHSQGEQLDSINRQTGEIGHKIKVAEAKASYLDKLSDSFLRPIFGGEKQVKPKKPDNFEWKSPSGPNGQPLWGRRVSSLPEEFPQPVSASAEPPAGKKGGMLGEWADEEDQRQSEMHERNINQNLEQIGGVVRGIKRHALALSSEIDKQNEVIRRTEDNVDESSDRLRGVNRKVEKVLRK